MSDYKDNENYIAQYDYCREARNGECKDIRDLRCVSCLFQTDESVENGKQFTEWHEARQKVKND